MHDDNEIRAFVEGLFKERQSGSVPNLNAGHSTEFDRVKGGLTAFAERLIIETCLIQNGVVNR